MRLASTVCVLWNSSQLWGVVINDCDLVMRRGHVWWVRIGGAGALVHVLFLLALSPVFAGAMIEHHRAMFFSFALNVSD